MFRDLMNHLKGQWHHATSYTRTGHSSWAQASTAWEGGFDKAANAIGKPFGMLGMGLLAIPVGAGLIAGSVGLLAAETTLRLAGRLALGRGLGAYSAAGGVVGLGTATSMLAGGLGFMALDAMRVTEKAFRVAMTGSPWTLMSGKGLVAPNAMDAYFPNLKRSWEDAGLSKIAPNPSIIRRAVGAYAITGGVRAIAGELFSPGAPAPSIFVDSGGNTRHKNDLGADASFGASMMGNRSIFNEGKSDLLRLAMYM